MADPDDLVLAITPDDRLLHTGTRRWLLDHVYGIDPAVGVRRDLHDAEPGAGVGALEVFDDSGHALRVADDGTDLVPVGTGDVDPDVLVGRVAHVLDLVREHLATHPELDVPPSAVPWATGPLPEVLALLERAGAGAPTTRPARHVPGSGLRQRLVAAGAWVWAASVRRAPTVTARVARVVGRLPGLGGAGDLTGDPTTPPVPPYLPPDGVPHNGNWLHNLWHRLKG
ncbi:hypothetical protein [Phycicoccus sonneratiae]|uniref:Uncharacterized protein n=1 Tax=Phycicoccus sonneratiae TaxID=2807628 RepID=A0ABS2CP24_9MICO|nr:hypothetical protein [Phycicoccus sonneraticus]MBM6400809.1 hypothetical protein [Phycicoccus sonneraticus]